MLMLLALVGHVILAIRKLVVDVIRYMYQKMHPYLVQVGNATLASQKMEIVVTKLKNRWIILKNSKR